ncbi:hypothetical protein GCM10008090_26830 [Arenicella chitinivorans]|uniref:DUF6249 domain-containing protein n=1 Tax=Arenicella chitinivorans TaxID=1329800 RepID=A0A918RYP3_9GAMM|nr:DUF6249 domain-containing protein [Arenicella chitinivorans]GHA15841.1 hypothetical protein GCM10008090_26830 [Arenicella chitinivorans]
MKNTLTTFSLALMMSISSFAFAQAADNQGVVEQSVETTVNLKDEDGKLRIGIEIDGDEELTSDEKFAAARKAIRENFGEEVVNDLEADISRLSNEDKEKIVKAIEDGITFDLNGSDMPVGAVIVATLAVLLIFGMPVFIVLLVLWFGHKKRRQRVELVNRFLDSGKEVPPEVLHTIDVDGGNSLRRGIMLTGIGAGIVAAFNVVGDSDIAGFGLIPLFIGIARLVYWYIAERKEGTQ